MRSGDGAVVWITGLSGAGKTTLARALLERLPGTAVLLDGDELRDCLSELATGYDRESRERLARTYARMAKLLADQGLTVVVATISLFHAVHEWNRTNQRRYLEVWLDAPEDVRRSRDCKGVYADGGRDDAAAYACSPELPQSPHVHIRNGADQGLEDSVQRVLEGLGRLGRPE